jgi:hypothetical protein
MEDDRSAGWRAGLLRWSGPAALLLALLLFLLLPLAGAACGRDDGGPAHLCYTGAQLISDEPSLDTSDILAGDAEQTAELRGAILNTVALPGGATVLAVIAAIVLALGVLSVAIPRPGPRAAVAMVTTLVGAVLMGITEIVVVNGLSDGAGNLPTLFGTFDDTTNPDDFVSTELGFWLALVALLAAAAVSVGSLIRLRSAEIDRQLREFGVAGDDG